MILFLYGNEPYLIRHTIDQMKESIENIELNYLKVENFDNEVLQSCYQYPLMSSKRLIHLSLDSFTMSEELEEYLGDPSELTDLVITCSSSPDKRTAFYKLLKKNECLKECKKISHSQLKTFVFRLLKESNTKITESAFDELLKRISYDMNDDCTLYTVKTIVNQLIYTGEAITLEVVERYVEKSKEDNIFSLATYVAQKDIRAIELLHTLLDAKESPIYILSLLLRHYRIGYKSVFFSAEEIGLAPYLIKQYGGISATVYSDLITKVSETINKIKIGYPGDVVLRTLVCELIA